MDNIDFLRQVLGDEGYYCILGITKKSDKPIQKFFHKLEDAVAVAKNLADEGIDAYYGLATFIDGKSRKKPNVKQLKSLFVDIDCGEKKPYENQVEGFTALKKFCKSTGMPRPTIINSGGGLHAYWVFTEAIPRTEWMPLADKFKYMCDVHDFHVDPAVTADSVRVLRVPGAFNFKFDTPRVVELFRDPAPMYTVEDLKKIIGEPIVRKSYIPRGELDEVTKNILGNYANRFKTILLKTSKGEGCQQLGDIYENQATMPEPRWRAGLSVAKFCVDADIAIKKLSEKHPEYTEERTEAKVQQIKGFYSCEKFEELNPGGCSGCPNKGNIKYPIVLGREVLEATEEDNIVEDVPEINQGNTQVYVIPKYPEPYFRGKIGGIYKRMFKAGEEEEESTKEVMIYQHDMYVTRRLLDAESGEAVVVRLHLPKDGIREFTIPLTAITSKEEIRKEMSKRGVAMAKVDELMYYMTTWVHAMQFTGRADMARRQFGWVDDKFDAFVLGNREIGADRVDYNPPSSATSQLMPAFEPKGDLETWKEAMEFYNRPDMALHQFMIGACFGALFTKFTPINGAILHVYSTDSGIGKSTAYEAGMSMWGDPKKLILRDEDTKNSKFNRAEIFCNIAAVIDELTNAEPRVCSEYAYGFTGGLQRNRMSGSSNLERHRGNPWHTLALTNGNTSMIQKMSTYKATPKGEAMRVLEFCAKPVEGLDKQITDVLSAKIQNNYGHAALPYLQFIMQDIEGVKALFKTIQKKLDERCGFGPADRFHSVILADSITGLTIAKRVGLINFDIKAVVEWVVAAVKDVKQNFNSMDTDAETTLTNFIAENYNNILNINSTDDARSSKDVLDHIMIPNTTPRFQYVARYECDIHMFYIMMPPLKAWCVKKQINYDGLIESLKKGRTQAKIAKKRMGKGTKMSFPSVDVLWVNGKDFHEDIATKAVHQAALEGVADESAMP